MNDPDDQYDSFIERGLISKELQDENTWEDVNELMERYLVLLPHLGETESREFLHNIADLVYTVGFSAGIRRTLRRTDDARHISKVSN